MRWYSGEQMDVEHIPQLQAGEKDIVLITQDESIFRENDDIKYARIHKSQQFLRPKGEGRGLMVSAFICHCHGILVDGEDNSRTILKYGRNYDGYWSGDDVAKAAAKVFYIAQRVHPEYQLLFVFDNSTNHSKKPLDALNASRLNLSDGGVYVRTLRNGYYTTVEGTVVEQPMQDIHGVQKGLKSILAERGL
jgi:hypothetical protein